MLKALKYILCVTFVFALAAGCSDETKYQYGLRGRWQLESRKLPDGTVLQPPAISGHYEWYPTAKTTAQITASVATGQDQIQVSGYTLTLEDPSLAAQGFTQSQYLNIGGGYGTVPQQVYDTSVTKTTGNISLDGKQLTLNHANGRLQRYANVNNTVIEGAVFAVQFKDGTVDTWRRFADQLGVLPK